jgi:hypothetical protein
MRYEVLYIIRPKQALLQAVKNHCSEMRDIFSEEVVLKGFESDRSSWITEDYVVRAKLSFLIELHAEYSDAKEYQTLFGMDKLMLSTFDNWWTLNRYEISGYVEEASQIEASEISLTGNENVDSWLANKIRPLGMNV